MPMIVSTLKATRLAMYSVNNTFTTDRPDLPRSEETSWTVCFDKEVDLIDQTLKAISDLNNGPE